MILVVDSEFTSDGADKTLWETAQRHTIDTLKRHGNIVSKDQEMALHMMIGSFVYTIALPQQQRREAFPLPCGAGKTTAVRGLIRAIHQLNRECKIVVCAEKVEGLCQLKRDLAVEDDVPINKISLLHSYVHDPDFDIGTPEPGTASEPSDSADLSDLRQFVLMTHQKLQGGFNSMPFDLLIYDESLVLGKGTAINFEDLFGAIGKLVGAVLGKGATASKDQSSLSTWATQVQGIISQTSDGDILNIPDLTVEVSMARKLEQAINKQDQALRNFIGLVKDGADLRVMAGASQGSSIISIEQTIPDDLNNFAVLDASFPIRKLMTYDKTISSNSVVDKIKDHSDVTIHVAKAKAGRTHLMETLASGDDPKLFDEVAHLVADLLRKGRKILVFTFKDDGKKKPSKKLRESIDRFLGDDVEHADSELNFLTWGYETALNRYSHCDAVVFAGLLTLPTAAVAAMIFAHSLDIRLQITPEELNEVVHSEKVHSLYQALSRGSCRIMNNGKAMKMDAYVFTPDYLEIKKSLKEAMPGVQFKDYTVRHINKSDTKKDSCKEAFKKALMLHNDDTISIKTLNHIYMQCGPDTKKTALDELLDTELAFEWKRVERRLERIK